MPKKINQASAKQDPEHYNSSAVTTLVAGMTHPLKSTIEAVRRTILAADPGITEGVKWNSPSFYCHGWFATISSRKPTQLDVVLYCGAKVRADSTVRELIDDPDGLLTWPSKDRALLSFKSEAEFQARRKPFRAIVKKWAGYQKSYAKNA
ncbi:MAG: DUF1801 domain-containing protein [Verrucomicrobia bacterium]|nr:MAG: DUF1801 domain-containing protein [Verrucomicrobiota bacterium]